MMLSSSYAQETSSKIVPAVQERYSFRIHYGFLNAVYASLTRTKEVFNQEEVSHVVGTGSTTGLARLFVRVDDTYQSYYNSNYEPQYFKRSVIEGGYEKEEDIRFDYGNNIASVFDATNNKTTDFTIVNELQDLLSYYFFLKSKVDPSTLKKGTVIETPILFDSDGIHYFKVEYKGIEVVNTAFGEKQCYKFKPYIDFGSRVFGNNKNFWVWISKDQLLPVKVKAPLVIGSITVDLENYYISN